VSPLNYLLTEIGFVSIIRKPGGAELALSEVEGRLGLSSRLVEIALQANQIVELCRFDRARL
jgi:hypothetical protein